MRRVLVVDDNSHTRKMLKDILVSGGFEIAGEAENGAEAIDKFKELKPDLTTMDVVMPGKSGVEATREILRFDAKAVVVMCSSEGQATTVMDAIEAGALDFIEKPLTPERVLSVLKKVLGAKRA